MTRAWAARFIEVLDALVIAFGVEPADVEDAFEQFLYDCGHEIEFQDPAEVDEFREYYIEHCAEDEEEEDDDDYDEE